MANAATSPQAIAPPRAAAVAGVLFAVLMGSILTIARLAAPAPGEAPGDWVTDPFRLKAVRFAVQLAPFAGIAFLWFIGVLRNRLGRLEDQFFATVFLGSGLLFVASLFASAAFSAALIESVISGHPAAANGEAFFLMRQLIRTFMNVFAIKMAGVFMMSTSTILWRTGILPRIVPLSGFACAAVLLLAITNWPWIALLFPCWMLLVSLNILIAEYRRSERDQTV
jgi:hypothetical protein